MAAGAKTGGRQKGSLNKSTRVRLQEIAVGGELPLDYMLRVMRDQTNEHSRRDEMSRAAAPYVHAKLSATEVTGKDGVPLIPDITDEQRAKALAVFLAKNAGKVKP